MNGGLLGLSCMRARLILDKDCERLLGSGSSVRGWGGRRGVCLPLEVLVHTCSDSCDLDQNVEGPALVAPESQATKS